MNAERWLPVVGYEGRYEVSDHGRVRNVRKTKRGPAGRLLKAGPGAQRYPVVTLSANGHRKAVTVHRLVLAAFVGPCPDGWHGRHLDGGRTNNRLDNLAWGTPQQNSDDTKRHGARWSKLTQEDVDEIRATYALGRSQYRIGLLFGIRQSQVSNIVLCRQWRPVSGEES